MANFTVTIRCDSCDSTNCRTEVRHWSDDGIFNTIIVCDDCNATDED